MYISAGETHKTLASENIMKNLLSSAQLKSVESYVQEQARLRCIPTVVSLEEILRNRNNEHKLSLTSTPFNTVPVLHSEITLEDFGSSVFVDEKNKDILNVFIRVSARYEGNGVELFVVSGYCFKGDDRFYKN